MDQEAELVRGQSWGREDLMEASLYQMGGLDEGPCRWVMRRWDRMVFREALGRRQVEVAACDAA